MHPRDKWALVTGASGGMGAEFASLLAQRGYNLVLAARNANRLRVSAKQLHAKYAVQVHVERSDLSEPSSADTLSAAVTALGIEVDVLINNAGSGMHGDFVDARLDKVENMLRLNMVGLTALTHLIATGMAKRERGHVLLVSSLTAYMPSPTYAAYAATKAYVRHFGEALHAELGPRNVVVTVLSPGLMDTGFLDAAGQQPSKTMRRSMTSPRATAEAGLDALFVGRRSVVAGLMNRAVATVSPLIPRGTQIRMMASMLNG